jgi:hypothetical protein
MASSILRKFSACRSSLEENGMAPIFCDPLDDVRDLAPEELLDALRGRQGVLDDVMKKAGGDRRHVQFHVRQKVGDLERMDQVRLAGVADLALMLERREYVGAAEQLEIGLGAVTPHFFEQGFESNHANRCLNS